LPTGAQGSAGVTAVEAGLHFWLRDALEVRRNGRQLLLLKTKELAAGQLIDALLVGLEQIALKL